MKENSREEDIEIIGAFNLAPSLQHISEEEFKDVQKAMQHILLDYKRVLKENEELKENKTGDEELELYQNRVKQFNIVLSMLEEKDKQIDLMAKFIEDELTVDEFCTKEGCYADNYIDGHCEKCLNCIKHYFENEAKEVE